MKYLPGVILPLQSNNVKDVHPSKRATNRNGGEKINGGFAERDRFHLELAQETRIRGDGGGEEGRGGGGMRETCFPYFHFQPLSSIRRR